MPRAWAPLSAQERYVISGGDEIPHSGLNTLISLQKLSPQEMLSSLAKKKKKKKIPHNLKFFLIDILI